jgi:hypothetical protein
MRGLSKDSSWACLNVAQKTDASPNTEKSATNRMDEGKLISNSLPTLDENAELSSFPVSASTPPQKTTKPPSKRKEKLIKESSWGNLGVGAL